MLPKIIKGNCHSDYRGNLKYNNDFNSISIKRMYVIENKNPNFKRGWQGHKIEQRWFSAMTGSFEIKLINVDDWGNPSSDLKPYVFFLSSENLDVLHIPQGYISCIQSKEETAKLLVMSDYLLGEIKDEYKYPLEHFMCTK
ncbi:WxcM-like domain-containing protein [Flavobacterium terrae]|uniref:WxcM-like, C-terminal n=1 Tax=Flavobacterium terrae TaxID=415425 RepID=A0A1M6FSU3_9FLAO|nr:WxcM-like domain-containing protein [Flavobacterium terrae]SHJ00761.1 WxcM-like, C-terminal [Flavobacterium terrae]